MNIALNLLKNFEEVENELLCCEEILEINLLFVSLFIMLK